MKLRNTFLTLLAGTIVFCSCSDDEDNAVLPVLNSSGLDKTELELNLGESLTISPKLNTDDVEYQWVVNEEVLSREANYTFKAEEIGDYNIKFSATNGSGSVNCNYQLAVIKFRTATKESSAYLTTVFEYKPAPSDLTTIDRYMDFNSIIGNNNNSLDLGAWGGYVIAGFDHTISNREGKEIVVFSDIFDGASEPAIVVVSFDSNGNNKPDDKWFELAGSEYYAEKTIHNYEITYTNPHGKKDIPWEDNQGETGSLIMFSESEYYPNFIPEQESVVFKGTKLETKASPTYNHPIYGFFPWKPAREWGYASNYSEEYLIFNGNTFDIDWAVDNEGKKVTLPGVDFIKIYTAENANVGWKAITAASIKSVADLSLIE